MNVGLIKQIPQICGAIKAARSTKKEKKCTKKEG
jgi:hypothetical protein